MTVYYLCPGSPETISGGTRKLYDHVAILQAHGFDAKIVYNNELHAQPLTPNDVVVVPEVYGDGLRDFVPQQVKKIAFVQNGYLIDKFGISDRIRHPFLTTFGLLAIFTESEHTEALIGKRFSKLPVPLIRTHSSGNGRNGQPGPFRYGPWPRTKEVVYFDYKHEFENAGVLVGLQLPDGWAVTSMTGMTDEQIAEKYRTAAIFAACNTKEGMCAPTSEAIISGAVIVCWPGGPKHQSTVGGPMEYLTGRAVVVDQDNIDALREAIVDTARAIDADPELWAKRTREWSDWFQETYSREGEIQELCRIFTDLGYGPK